MCLKNVRWPRRFRLGVRLHEGRRVLMIKHRSIRNGDNTHVNGGPAKEINYLL